MKKLSFLPIFLAFLLASTAFSTKADYNRAIREYLKKFKLDPRTVLNSHLPKFTPDFRTIDLTKTSAFRLKHGESGKITGSYFDHTTNFREKNFNIYFDDKKAAWNVVKDNPVHLFQETQLLAPEKAHRKILLKGYPSCPAGTTITRKIQGLLISAGVKEVLVASNKHVKVSSVDKARGRLLFMKHLDYPAGTRVTEEVQKKLSAAGITRVFLTTIETKLASLPLSNKLKKTPWSSDYWPLKAGNITARYGDINFTQFAAGKKYTEIIEFYKQPEEYNMLTEKYGYGEELNYLEQIIATRYSPSEKYDLLVGDLDFALTNTLKTRDRNMIKDGDIDSWMGICHGWAVASYLDPRPEKTSFTVLAADGITTIKFWADDLKALSSLKWAQTPVKNLFVGGRCNVKEPETDPETGRITEEACNDTNPGTFHIVLANKLMRQQSFVIDATYDFEVWNQPVSSYKLAFFNPETLKIVDQAIPIAEQIEQASVNHRMFVTDRFRNFRRNPEATWVIGVVNQISYIAETPPKQEAPIPDQIVTVRYLYDLELDGSGNIVGGEWYTNLHPDFLWTVPGGVRPLTRLDIYLAKQNLTYDGTFASLQKIRKVKDSTGASIVTLSSNGWWGIEPSPLATVVDGLLKLAGK